MTRRQSGTRRPPGTRARVLALARRRGLIRSRDFQGLGIHRVILTRLTREGILERVGRGLYRLAEAAPMGAPDLVLVAARVPQAVVALVSALSCHGMTVEIPKTVDLLLPRGMSPPKIDYPPLRVFRASGASFDEGIAEVELDGVQVRITSPAKTAADCFKFRRRVGMEVAREALREGLSRRLFTPAEFARMARVDRVLGIARPYVETLS